MSFGPDLQACAALVERGDPDRFRAVMAAPVPARRILFPIYAANVEISRAPYVTQEPMIAEIRLQWWHDALEEIASGAPVRRHEVVTPLAAALPPDLAGVFRQAVEARLWDVAREPFADRADFEAHLDASAGTLLWVAARALGEAEEAVVRRAGRALGLANWLRAVPELQSMGLQPLPDDSPEAIRSLAGDARADLAAIRADRQAVSRAAAPAMLSLWSADKVLAQAERNPSRVRAETLGPGPASGALVLALRATTGRW